MAMYVRVYAPNGEPFDVTRERADTLLLQEGWTQTPIVTEPSPTQTAEPFEEMSVVEDGSEEDLRKPETELPVAPKLRRRKRGKAADADPTED